MQFSVIVFVLCSFNLSGCSTLHLLNIATLESSAYGRLLSMQLFHGHNHEDKLKCPYKGCEKAFDKPTVITDNSVIPRQTHYACPYCMSKVELITEKNKVIDVKPTEYATVLDSPAKCAYFSGLLPPYGASLLTQDECLICPKVMQCNLRRK